MKKLLLASAALMALSIGGNAVQAADMPVKAIAPLPVFTWSGCYVGVHVGYKWGESVHTYTGRVGGVVTNPERTGTEFTDWFNVDGALGGGEAGCQYQWGNWVWGIEGDGSWVGAEGQSYEIATGAPFSPFNYYHKTSERWMATVRGRLGYAWDKWLWYVTAGGAWAGVDVAEAFIAAPTSFTGIERNTVSGWVAGWGTEYSVGHGWSVKYETLYVDFGTFSALDNPVNCPTCLSRDVDLHQWIWRVGMNYRFDIGKGVGKYPVAAKY
jgi:outer membrane immunogenic protein